jgi:hypothetical protein
VTETYSLNIQSIESEVYEGPLTRFGQKNTFCLQGGNNILNSSLRMFFLYSRIMQHQSALTFID